MCVGRLLSRLVLLSKFSVILPLLIRILGIVICITGWLGDVLTESNGWHIPLTQDCVKLGMVWFVFSEVIFFAGLFWTWVHVSLRPDVSVGMVWPPVGIVPLNPWRVPLLNTLILLARGATLTWSHHLLITRQSFITPLLATVLLGVWFLSLQAMEYIELSYTISDSVFGRGFYTLTGFHGFHVILGTSILMVCLLLAYLNEYDHINHIRLECVGLYWHIVDVVWLGLYLLVYHWSR